MRRLKKACYACFGFLVIVGLVAASGGYLCLRSSLPPTAGRLTVAGLQAPVEVIRDRWGIPHIYAQTEEDAFFAEGYVHAQDRLWQMELGRRAARGTLAEVLGSSALPGDRLARTLGFARAAEAEWAQMDAEGRAALEAYSRGVNAYLAAPDRLPLEFRLLGLVPDPWRPEDTLAWARLLAWCLDGEWRGELVRARLVQAVGAERAAELEPALSDSRVLAAGSDYLTGLPASTLLEAGAQVWPWAGRFDGLSLAVGGSKTAGGGAILASAPALPAQMPSPWYEVQVVGGRYDVIGASFPGLPGVVLGRNRAIAWGLSGAMARDMDLYVERIRPGDPPQFEFQGQWQTVTVREETIRVRGQAAPEHIEVYATRHGPLVGGCGLDGQVDLALRWAGAEGPAALVRGILAVDRAGNWSEFQSAVQGWAAPALTLAYADTQGTVGYAAVAAGPAGNGADEGLPLPGWTGAWEWTGAPAAGLRSEVRAPMATLLVTRGMATPTGWPDGAVGGAEAPGVAGHIAQLLDSRGEVTPEDVWAIAHDDQGAQQPLLALLLAMPPKGWLQERTMPYLRAWDLRYDAESLGAGIFETFCWKLAHNTWDDELGAELVDAYLNSCPDYRAVLERLASAPDSPWFDDHRTPEREGRDIIVARSFADAVDWLGRRFGDLPYEWNWGRVHNVTFHHSLGQSWPLDLLLNRGAMRAGGGPGCAYAVVPDYAHGMAVAEVPYSMVMDLGTGGRAMAMNSTGESGNALSAHYADMIGAWRTGDAHPLLYEREGVLQAGGEVLNLVPVA